MVSVCTTPYHTMVLVTRNLPLSWYYLSLKIQKHTVFHFSLPLFLICDS